MSPNALQSYQTDLLIQAEQVGALKFGQFTLKSGRYAPIARPWCHDDTIFTLLDQDLALLLQRRSDVERKNS